MMEKLDRLRTPLRVFGLVSMLEDAYKDIWKERLLLAFFTAVAGLEAWWPIQILCGVISVIWFAGSMVAREKWKTFRDGVKELREEL